eukprot:scaffold5528_cov27-Tisochrysis_lutea.AAC.7
MNGHHVVDQALARTRGPDNKLIVRIGLKQLGDHLQRMRNGATRRLSPLPVPGGTRPRQRTAATWRAVDCPFRPGWEAAGAEAGAQPCRQLQGTQTAWLQLRHPRAPPRWPRGTLRSPRSRFL